MDSGKNDKENNYNEYELWKYEHDTPESKLEEIERKIDDIESEIHEIKDKMLTEGKLFGWIISIGIFALWGDKIWTFVKGIFLFLAGLYHSTIQGAFTPTEPLQLIISMVFAGLTIIVVIIGLIFGIASLIIR